MNRPRSGFAKGGVGDRRTAALRLEHGMYQLAVGECALCRQFILPDRQMSFDAIIKLRQGMCPSCRQRVGPATQKRQWYQIGWLDFVRRAGLRWRSGD